MDDSVYKMQEDRIAILEYENSFTSPMSVSNLVELGFIPNDSKSSLRRLYYSLKGFTLHCDTLDNRIFVFYLNNKHINISTMRDLINLINIIQ